MKGPYCNPKIKENLTIIDRSSVILPEFLGKSISVYNGKEYKTFGKITIDHIGKKFGEFSPTKRPAIYKRK
jgi:small subunit ribosomal protein S19